MIAECQPGPRKKTTLLGLHVGKGLGKGVIYFRCLPRAFRRPSDVFHLARLPSTSATRCRDGNSWNSHCAE
eukprot:1148431-Pyramimonas_sp.AAC.1